MMTIPGCQLAHRLATDPSWFKDQVPVTDDGRRPRHAAPFKGLMLPAPRERPLTPTGGSNADELQWLNASVLDWAGTRPEQVDSSRSGAISGGGETSTD